MRLKLFGKHIVIALDDDGEPYEKLYDRAVAARPTGGNTGALQVRVLRNEARGFIRPLMDPNWNWVCSDALLKRVEVLNPTSEAQTFSLAMPTSIEGTPDIGDAVLACGTTVKAGEVWRWSGRLPLYNHLFVQASAPGLVVFYEVEEF